MDSKLLTESGWKAIASKFKVKDNGLQRALATYEKFDENQHDERLKAIASVSQLAGSLTKAKDAAAIPEAAKYLRDLLSAADDAKAEISKAKAAAEKAQAVAQKKADNQAKQQETEDEEEDEQGEYHVKLLAAFQKLKSAKDVAFQFIVCDAKPHSGLMVAKKITSKHKEELTKVTGGSKRFLHTGTCQFVDGKFDFRMEQPVTGLARKLQDSIKSFTGKKLPLRFGTESAEGDEEQPLSGQASAASAAKPKSQALANAPIVWHGVLDTVKVGIEQLKAAAMAEFANDGKDIVNEVQQCLSKFDGVLVKLDRSLTDSLTKAHAANDASARSAELKKSKAILTDFILHVKSDELIAHLDANPWGVKTNLKHNLSEGLKHMAEAIGRVEASV